MSDELLRIDFQAALAKLAPAQLQGTWQLPTELVRLAIAAGARRAEVALGRNRLELVAAGARLPLRRVDELARALDEGAPPALRHRAFADLEEADALALAVLATLPIRRLLLVSGGAAGERLEARRGEPVRRAAKAGDDLVAIVEGCELAAAAAARFLERHGRFAPIPIVVDRRELRRGFRGSLVRTQIGVPLPAALSIPLDGEAPRLWLLRYGIISTRATIPGLPPFEAAVEMAGIGSAGSPAGGAACGPAPRPNGGRTTGAALREAVQPHLDGLIRAATSLLVHLAEDVEGAPERVRQRAARLALLTLRRGEENERLRAARLFPLVDADGARRFVSLAELEARVPALGEPARTLATLTPEQPLAAFVAGQPVLVVSVGERALLGEHLGGALRAPPPRPRARREPRHLLAELTGSLTWAWQGWRGRMVGESELEPAERAFLRALAAAWPPPAGPRPAFCRGGGGVRAARGGRLLLPRENPAVRAALAVVARDPDWLYPALLGLTGGRDLPPEELRERWRRRAP